MCLVKKQERHTPQLDQHKDFDEFEGVNNYLHWNNKEKDLGNWKQFHGHQLRSIAIWG